QWMAPEWANTGWATAVNALFAQAGKCRRRIVGNRLDFRDSGVRRNDESAINQRISNEGSLFSLPYPFHFSMAEVSCRFFWRLRVVFATWACHALNGPRALRLCSRAALAAYFALRIPISLLNQPGA
ncbi:MAG: hypothetical protein QMB52_01540, partial [Propionivibrio sp.]